MSVRSPFVSDTVCSGAVCSDIGCMDAMCPDAICSNHDYTIWRARVEKYFFCHMLHLRVIMVREVQIAVAIQGLRLRPRRCQDSAQALPSLRLDAAQTLDAVRSLLGAVGGAEQLQIKMCNYSEPQTRDVLCPSLRGGRGH